MVLTRLLRYGGGNSCAATNLARYTRLSLSSSVTLLDKIAGVTSTTHHNRHHRYRYYSSNQRNQYNAKSNNIFMVASAIVAASAGVLSLSHGGSPAMSQCEEATASVDNCSSEDIEELELPTYTMDQVSQHNGKGPNKRIWMTYGGCVYDTTDFIANHPGGSEKILLAAGGPIEPHWHLYRQHFATDLPQELMEKMLIGNLHPNDQDKVDNMMEKLTDNEESDPYAHEPTRSINLIVHGDTPMNAEVPSSILNQSYITPVEEFYIRHHHPVPLLGEQDVKDFRLNVDLTLLSPSSKKQPSQAKLSLDQIKSLPKVEVTSTLQCSGNRRSGFNDLRRTSGTPWGQGAISTARWGGARLSDVLILASEQCQEEDDTSSFQYGPSSTTRRNDTGDLPQTLRNIHTLLNQNPNLRHLRFESLDGMLASIDISKAFNPFGDVIVAYEMNGKPLPRDHGYPLRVIVPGYAAVRNVKWLSKLELAEEEAEGAWQRGLNYKVLPPSVLDAKEVDLDKIPGLSEVSVFSGITNVSKVRENDTNNGTDTNMNMVPGETVLVKASGWAWAGGGRNIVRVDVTGNGGKSWSPTTIVAGGDQPFGRAWAWVFWQSNAIPALVCEDGKTVELSCKGVDMAFNTQPESSDGMWNVRGLANNSWYRLRCKV